MTGWFAVVRRPTAVVSWTFKIYLLQPVNTCFFLISQKFPTFQTFFVQGPKLTNAIDWHYFLFFCKGVKNYFYSLRPLWTENWPNFPHFTLNQTNLRIENYFRFIFQIFFILEKKWRKNFRAYLLMFYPEFTIYIWLQGKLKNLQNTNQYILSF